MQSKIARGRVGQLRHRARAWPTVTEENGLTFLIAVVGDCDPAPTVRCHHCRVVRHALTT